MNREIKFRAWNKVWGMMLPVDEIDFKQQSVMVTVEASDYNHEGEWQDYEIGEDIILMQFTGLKDKNGKEIYEGDVLLENGGWDENGRNVVVRFEDDYGWVVSPYVDGKRAPFTNKLRESLTIRMRNKNPTIVGGNVYENPELLTNSKE